MKNMKNLVPAALIAVLSWLASAPAAADLVIGQTSGFSGPVESSVKELSLGATLYFDAVNAGGGVHGERIRLVQLDDKFDPQLAAQNARVLITEHDALALFLSRGTPHTQAIMPLLVAHRIPLVAPSTGAMAMHQPVHPYVFNVRATYQREADRAIRHLGAIGIERIAVLHVDDSFGADAAAGAAKGFDAIGRKPVLLDKFDRAKPDFGGLAARVAKAGTQAVLVIGTAAAVAKSTQVLRAAGSRAQVLTLSNNASAGFIKLMGHHAHGTIVTQVFPYERSLAAPVVREAADLARVKGIDVLSPAMVEGYAAAKVLVEGLKRAGPRPTRTRLVAALDGMQQLNIGGMQLSFSPADHTGLDFVDLSIISASGKFVR